MTIRRRIRDAITGRFTTRDHATAHPDTTVEESVERAKKFAREQAGKPYPGDARASWERAMGHITGNDPDSVPEGWKFSDEFAQEIFDAIHDEVHLWVEDHRIESATREVIAVLVARGLYR